MKGAFVVLTHFPILNMVTRTYSNTHLQQGGNLGYVCVCALEAKAVACFLCRLWAECLLYLIVLLSFLLNFN